MALDEALHILGKISTPIDLKNRDQLIECVNTALSSKVVSANSKELSPISVDAVMKLYNLDKERQIDLRDIKVVKKIGGTIEDTEMIDGLVFTKNKPSHSAGGPSRIENAKIALIQFCVSSP